MFSNFVSLSLSMIFSAIALYGQGYQVRRCQKNQRLTIGLYNVVPFFTITFILYLRIWPGSLPGGG